MHKLLIRLYNLFDSLPNGMANYGAQLRDLTPIEFASSIPHHVKRNTKMGIFGADSKCYSFSRTELRTPPEIRQQLLNPIPIEPLSDEAKRENIIGANYAIIKKFEEAREKLRIQKENKKQEEEKRRLQLRTESINS